MSLTSYLVAILLITSGVYVYKFLKLQKSNAHVDSDDDSDDDQEEAPVEQREFTLEELHEFDGEKNEKRQVYVSICGKVYNVTKSGFYGPGDPYHCFAGHDATMSLGKSSFNAKYLDLMDADIDNDLTPMEREDLEGHIENFALKYTVMGWLKEWRDCHGEVEQEERP